MAKVHKSVGFGSAERCNDGDNDDENIPQIQTGIWDIANFSLSKFQFFLVQTGVFSLPN